MDDVAQKVPAEQLTDKEQTPVAGTGRRPPILRSELIDRAYYSGWCRNTSVAQWHAHRGRFIYLRTKFGSTFAEEINHPEDDDGFDLFVPEKQIYPPQ